MSHEQSNSARRFLEIFHFLLLFVGSFPPTFACYHCFYRVTHRKLLMTASRNRLYFNKNVNKLSLRLSNMSLKELVKTEKTFHRVNLCTGTGLKPWHPEYEEGSLTPRPSRWLYTRKFNTAGIVHPSYLVSCFPICISVCGLGPDVSRGPPVTRNCSTPLKEHR
jgi:hypothetical protein